MPSTVGTSTYYGATAWGFQRKVFYTNNRFWVFWSDGTNLVYSTSINGIIWESPLIIRACNSSLLFSTWFDDIYLHYVFANNARIYYRRGVPNSDGTITWSTEGEQSPSTSYNRVDYPMVCVDSSGYVWIGYRDQTGASYYTYVIKSGNNDGTWGTTPSGFPYRLYPSSYSQSKASIIPLTLNKVLVIYYSNLNGPLRSICWNGSSWRTARTLSVPYNGWAHSGVPEGDDAHLVFLKKTSNDLIYIKYSYSTDNWSTDEIIQATTTTTSDPVLCRDINSNELYCFWFKSPSLDNIYYKKRIGEIWNISPTDWIIDTLAPSDNRVNCFYKNYGNKIGIIYCSQLVSPFNIRFEYMNTFIPSPQGGILVQII